MFNIYHNKINSLLFTNHDIAYLQQQVIFEYALDGFQQIGAERKYMLQRNLLVLQRGGNDVIVH